MCRPRRARELDDGLDRELLDVLDAQGFLDFDAGASLLDAVLLVEQAERSSPAHRWRHGRSSRRCMLKTTGSRSDSCRPAALVRYAGLCDTYLFLDDDAPVAEAAQVTVEPVESRWGYPLGRVTSDSLTCPWHWAYAAERLADRPGRGDRRPVRAAIS